MIWLAPCIIFIKSDGWSSLKIIKLNAIPHLVFSLDSAFYYPASVRRGNNICTYWINIIFPVGKDILTFIHYWVFCSSSNQFTFTRFDRNWALEVPWIMAASWGFGVKTVRTRFWWLHLSTEMSQAIFPYIDCRVNLIFSDNFKCQDIIMIVMTVNMI